MAVVGTGFSVTFSSGFLAEILSGKHTGIERPVIDTTHMGTTTARTKIPGSLFDSGRLECELQFDPSTKPPILGNAETVTQTHSDGSTWAQSGFLVSFEQETTLEDKATATAVIEFSGDITVT